MDANQIASSITRFALKFLNVLDFKSSLICSPLSAEILLGLLTLGSENPSHDELISALSIPDDDSIRTVFSDIVLKQSTIKGVQLRVANKIYVKTGGYELKDELRNDAVRVFDAEIDQIDFKNNIEAAGIINEWVESKTNNLIRDLVPPIALNEGTRLVLVNAIYFKGNWKDKFNPNSTRPVTYHVTSNQTKMLNMMYKQSRFKYGENFQLKCKFLEIPYESEEASMLIVLPYDIDGLGNVLKTLADGYDLQQDIRNMLKSDVRVFLPKFKIETQVDLMPVISQIGIKSVFREAGSGLTKLLKNDDELSVTAAMQKAYIEVNEEGAEAAAATFVAVGFPVSTCFQDPVKNFVADRPFLVMIMIGNLPYFMGCHCG